MRSRTTPRRWTSPTLERLSRGSVLVKWWLLAIPQYAVAAVFAGGAAYTATGATGHAWQADALSGGLDRAAGVLRGDHAAVRGPLPAGLYDFVVGMNRWVVRVIAYAASMTDHLPFGLDQGGAGCLPPHLTTSHQFGRSGPSPAPQAS